MKVFLKQDQIQLINGGYLSTTGKTPEAVTNDVFVAAQKSAEYIITFATLAKGKTFSDKKADSIADLRAAVSAALSAKETEYITSPSKPNAPTTKKLADEALAFMNFTEESFNAKKVNTFLQNFNVLNEFKEFGLFFEPGIVKLETIYTMDQVTEAVTSIIELLD
jgi:hypothetical protein